MPSRAAASYEVSLRAHKDPEVGRRLRPAYPPFWVESREVSKHYTLSYIFYDDAVRGSLLHARELRSQVFPHNRDDAPALDPSRCKGVWYLPTPELAQSLKAVESDMIAVFESLKIGNAQGNVMPLAGYLRQLYDHFLYVLARSAATSRDQGTFANPIPLNSVEEPHMKNALNNNARGQSYKVGAWMVDSLGTMGGEGDDRNLRTTQGKRTRDTEVQITPSTASSNDMSTGASIAISEPDHDQEVVRKPKRLRLITSVSPKADNLTQQASSSPRPSDDRSIASTARSSSEQQEHGMAVDSGSGSDTPVDMTEMGADADVDESEDGVDVGNWEVFLCTDYGQIRLVGSEDGKISEDGHAQIRYAPIPDAVVV
ncbi:hypothetical protein FS837_008724 [Tulasnella sp. UAMH 9824]|nr:hypothetical protein FS837_008724 [Tulasnella sp. UAMH 9824]